MCVCVCVCVCVCLCVYIYILYVKYVYIKYILNTCIVHKIYIVFRHIFSDEIHKILLSSTFAQHIWAIDSDNYEQLW